MKNTRFEVIERKGTEFSYVTSVIVDKETGVNYLFFKDGYGGGLTVLVDADGKPIITKDVK